MSVWYSGLASKMDDCFKPLSYIVSYFITGVRFPYHIFIDCESKEIKRNDCITYFKVISMFGDYFLHIVENEIFGFRDVQ